MKKNIFESLKTFLYRFSSETATREDKRRVALLVGLSAIGIFFLLLFGTIALLQRNIPLFTFDFTTAFILLLNLLDVRIRNRINFNISVGIAFVSALYVFLYITGGTYENAFVWYFTYPLIASYLLGSLKGGVATILMGIPIVGMVVIDPNNPFFAQYDINFEIRFLGSYVVVGFFSYLFERTREESRQELASINQGLEQIVKDRTSELMAANAHLLREIEERKNAHRAMRQTQESLITILDSIDATIYVADIETYEILFMNKYMKESFGKDMTGELCWSAFRNESGPCGQCTNPRLLDSRNRPTGVYVWQGKHPKTEKWNIYYDRAIKWIDGRLVRIQIALDMTDHKKLEEELRQVRKMESIGTLAGGIAHDFNNILSSVIGFTELALNEVDRGTLVDEHLQEILTAGLRAKDLVRQILIFARQTNEERTPVLVKVVAEETLKFIRASIPTSIQITQRLEGNTMIMGDATQIHQVFMNLCTNAAHSMEEGGGELSINLEDIRWDIPTVIGATEFRPGDYLQITVADTGKGISEEDFESIFEPYFTTKGPGEGTGMGLALVHGIVKSYGGEISVESEEGKGTAINIYLPALKRNERPRGFRSEALSEGIERILFVDDEFPIVRMGSQTLGSLGYKVTSLTDSVEALELFKRKPDRFDLVISDMGMPKMTGDKLAEELMKIRPDIPIILCTGYSKKMSQKRAAEIGISAFMVKPLFKQDMAETVRKVLDTRPASKKNEPVGPSATP
ncbi:ATP-binding protein [Thermodesulfobacteriota bacterium]